MKNETGFDLVLQAPAALPLDLDGWTKDAGAEGWEEVRQLPPVYRLCHVSAPSQVSQAAANLSQMGFDVALVPHARRLQEVCVVAMDMDSTLITIECIDEIADMIGIKPQVAEITERAMRGEIDFRDSLRARVALLKGVPETDLATIYDTRLTLSPGAEAMLEAFHTAGAKSLLVSGGFTFFTEKLRARLGFTHAVSNTLEIIDGKLTGRVVGDILGAAGKAAQLSAAKAKYATPEKPLTVAIGDGANDLMMFQAADVSFAYRAKPKVRSEATHAIDHCGLDAIVNCFC
ncbi:MAG: phosphoserine phosphatase SerB [Burkholderiales bacterium]|jgi:phosphoserine phosphatase|nr:phosphoserine phosphatase SerB [Burkholderiales bacterium]